MNLSGGNMKNNIVDKVLKLLEDSKTSETKWLESLSLYDCPTCGKETIFKSGCLDCEKNNEN